MDPFKSEIAEAAQKHILDPDLVAAFCCVESSFNPQAVRYEAKFHKKYIDPHPLYAYLDTKIQFLLSSSLGLMQVMGVLAHELGLPIARLSEMYQPATGLDYGCKKLKILFDRYADTSANPERLITHVISAYNAGNVRFKKDGKYVNQPYVDKVWAKYQEYRGQRG